MNISEEIAGIVENWCRSIQLYLAGIFEYPAETGSNLISRALHALFVTYELNPEGVNGYTVKFQAKKNNGNGLYVTAYTPGKSPIYKLTVTQSGIEIRYYGRNEDLTQGLREHWNAAVVALDTMQKEMEGYFKGKHYIRGKGYANIFDAAIPYYDNLEIDYQ